MRAIEFETQIQNGLIVLPLKYSSFNAKHTRIIVLVEEDEDSLMVQKKEKLRLAFRKLQEVNPFRNVIDGVEWQKQVRDEWEERIIR